MVSAAGVRISLLKLYWPEETNPLRRARRPPHNTILLSIIRNICAVSGGLESLIFLLQDIGGFSPFGFPPLGRPPILEGGRARSEHFWSVHDAWSRWPICLREAKLKLVF